MRQDIVITVLLVGPSDVAEDLKAAMAVVEELNRSSLRSHGLRLDARHWYRDVAPGIGSDPQDVINRQILDGVDIVLGCFWIRAGTPTPRWESGSIEEIETAIASSKTGKAVTPFIYFNEAPPAISSIDPDQLSKLMAFRKRLGAEGVLFKTYRDLETLESLLRADLTQECVRISAKVQQDSGSHIAVTSQSVGGGDDEEFGLLDYFDTYDSRLSLHTQLTEEITGSISNFTSALERRGDEMKAATENGPISPSVLRRLLARSAADLNSFASAIEERVQKMRQAAGEAFTALTKSLPLMSYAESPGSESFVGLGTSIQAMMASSAAARDTTLAFRDSVARFPRMTAEHNRAKKRAVAALDLVAEQFAESVALAEGVLVAMANIARERT